MHIRVYQYGKHKCGENARYVIPYLQRKEINLEEILDM